MEKLESISHLRQILFHEDDLIELMTNKGFKYVLTKIRERFCNINDFEEDTITNEVHVRFSSINHLIKDGKFNDGWKNLIMRDIYWILYEKEMDSEDKKYARRAGLGSSMAHYNINHRTRIIEIINNLEKAVLCNELKNVKQAWQFVDGLIFEKFTK